MLIQNGLKHKKFLGLRLHTKAPDFHAKFGSTAVFADINRDSGMTNYNQNLPNTVFDTPAMPNGCTAMATTDVMTDLKKVLYSPYYTYQQTCLEEGVPVGSELEMSFALNEPRTAGLEDLEGTITKTGDWYQVTPLNGSLFLGICSALTKGQSSVSFASTWYQSFDTPVNGVILPPSGATSGHNWKLCGIKTINGMQYLVGKPWLGSGWGEDGFGYFSQAIIDKIGGSAFTPMESEGETVVQVGTQTILESLINLLKRLELHFIGDGSNVPVSEYQKFEEEIQLIQNEITTYMHPIITKWAEAIEHEEGATAASHNPGNLKYSTLTASWGATRGRPATDGGNLCQFPTYQQGFTALCNFLVLGCENELLAFHSPEARTLEGFTTIFAGNPPEDYKLGIQEALGVPGTTLISTFI